MTESLVLRNQSNTRTPAVNEIKEIQRYMYIYSLKFLNAFIHPSSHTLTSNLLHLPGQPLLHPLGQKHQTHRPRIRRQIPRIRNIRRPPQLRRQLGRTLPTRLARLHRVSERRRFRESGDERDKGVHDGAVALARGGAPLEGGDGAGGG